MDEVERFKEEFYSALDVLLARYPNKDGEEREMLGYIINQHLHQVKVDMEHMNFIEFYDKYLKGTMFHDYGDFTNTQIKQIIDESPLSERDRKLASYYFIDMMCEEEIADRLMIDKKTVRNNIPKISIVLKKTSSKIKF